MLSLAMFSIRRPRTALAAWLLVGIALSLVGLGVSRSLSPSITTVPGTQSAQAQRLGEAAFGPTQLMPILLEGPKAQLDREGPRLVAALARRPHTRVLSAWDAGTASHGLRPRPAAAMIVVSIDRSEKAVVAHDAPQVDRLVTHTVTSPVRAYVSGQASIDRALKDASLSHLRRTELIAIGILFVLLLVGLRAPVAALLVIAVGAVSTLAGFGEVALLGHIVALDPVGIALGTMTGLAVSTGFALLILDRFHREELGDGEHPRDAVTAAVRELRTTGRAVLIGGSALILALAIVAVIGPTALMVSVGAGALTCAAFATGGAVVVMPAALVLLGRRIDAFSVPAPAPLARAWTMLVDGGNRVTRHAAVSGLAATALLAAIAIPALALDTGPASITQLPASSHARAAFQEISRVMGPGWPTPYNVLVVPNGRPVTTPRTLVSIAGLESQIARDPTVDSVTGPGQIVSTSRQLAPFGPSLRHSAAISDQSRTQLRQLIAGLGQAGSGSQQLQSGLAAAASGARQLNTGSGSAQSGAAQLHGGLAQARAGSATLADGLRSALSGAQALRNGAGQALAGSTQLVQGLGLAQTPAAASVPALKTLASDAAQTSSGVAGAQTHAAAATSSVNGALSALQSMTAGRSDPQYATAVAHLQSALAAVGELKGTIDTTASTAAGAKSLSSAIAYQSPGLVAALNMLHSGAAQLQTGIAKLKSGNAQLATGLGKLSGGGTALTSGLDQLTAGAGALQTGLGQLTNGTGELTQGLSTGVAPAGQLTAGLGTMQAAVVKARGKIPSTKALKQLERESPGIFSSGYFVLSAVEGATHSNRNAASFAINLTRGGTAGQIVVVSKYPSNDPRSDALRGRLAGLAATFARHNNAQVAVGGPAGSLGDLTAVTSSHIWLDIAVIAAAVALVLAVALRAVLLPVIATLFGLLVSAAAFGVLQLLFGGPDPLLGGPGYLDPVSVIGIFTVAFGITATFSTLLLVHTRAAFVASAGAGEAVRTGLRETAAAATGAGLVMAAGLIPFAASDLINLRQFGLGVTVAILLDVLVVRPVLLPAAEAVLGRAGWWPTTGGGAGKPVRAETPPSVPAARTAQPSSAHS
jgi:putative drug exporter of the RND superfamily